MDLKKKLKSNKGSSLVLVLLIVFFLTTICIAVMAVTTSEMRMSGLFASVNKAFFAAEAGVEKVAVIMDKKVADVQEAARQKATDDVNDWIDEYDDEDTDEVETPSQSAIDAKFEERYNIRYSEGICEDLFEQGDGHVISASGDNVTLKLAEFFGNLENVGGSTASIAHATLTLDGDEYFLETSVIGNYKDTKDTSQPTYTKTINVKLSLLPEPDEIAFSVVPKVKVNKLPSILKGRAVIAQKNIIAARGSVEIDGNALCFGTVPIKDDAEDQDADSIKYGGIIAGIDSADDAATNFGIDSVRVNSSSSASLTVTGNAATLSNIHVMYSDVDDVSSITIGGNAYARSIRSEKWATSSRITIEGSASTTDNVQIDSNDSEIHLRGAYFGMVNSSAIIASSGDTSDHDKISSFQPKRTSAIVVNGASKVFLNGSTTGGVYIGGSAFLKDLNNALFIDSNPKKYYMLGISALKATSEIQNAFLKTVTNKLYWYGLPKAGISDQGTLIEDNYRYYDIPTAKYIDFDPEDFDPVTGNPHLKEMLVGFSDDIDEMGNFTARQRGQHFKMVYKKWTDSGNFSAVLTDNIEIQAEDGKLYGFTAGAVTANSDVLTPNDFYNPADEAVNIAEDDFKGLMNGSTVNGTPVAGPLKEFYFIMQDFMSDRTAANAAEVPDFPQLDQVRPEEVLASYIDKGYIGTGKVENNRLHNTNRGIFFYTENDTDIYYSSGNWYIDGDGDGIKDGTLIPTGKKGIIYSEGNIYINSSGASEGFEFQGVLLSENNVVFNGNATISYDEDDEKDIVDLLNSDVGISGFMKIRTPELPDDNRLKTQRVSLKNIKIVDWNED